MISFLSKINVMNIILILTKCIPSSKSIVFAGKVLKEACIWSLGK